MKNAVIAIGLVVLGTAGCGGASDSDGSTITSASGAGAGGTGGAGFTPVGAGGAAAGLGGAGGSTSLAGSAGAAGSAPAGTPSYPVGTVALCFGTGCPMGTCDDTMFFTDTPCSSAYQAAVGPTSSYCNAGETDSYCMKVGTEFDPDFAVNCSNGMATVLKCDAGCGSNGVQYSCAF
ncbi:MAG TPA: hypothetical protein VK745_28005 [Polyangiaceae bacterium]|nr:hypothetical protein [Polyangiaceae bacterium]